mmetsp:Transcript_20276/g.33054  ORF Transcript_20276/g.33054 Transcript_20276/m.33054 type:complete len:454 (+) Transcript_20276:208-1569(+)|eukprot:CAMPEP_0201963938 /NCGR_PEP_ID=MMETSP0904-20121228/9698_1 /ASSEMBLY_ACC=CAM_ASM_000553 /TAXON_ID=420261 /ORGANISM="Thalassiosira antarctica, Strain CCMP982" /LENGTH=453 /DNA_ID=CAMNT_0048510685 /DNA_START=438 /DNA_END=1799 /DNA_ORIENTATION=-
MTASAAIGQTHASLGRKNTRTMHMLMQACMPLLMMLAVACMPVTAFVGRRSCSCSRSSTRQCRAGIFSVATTDSDRSCFWYEYPSETQRVPAPFGRAQKGVEERLQTLNWQNLRLCHEEEKQQRPVPSFTFKYPGAPTFCAHHPGISGPIRQIPASLDWDNHVDDKLRLHLLLSTNSTMTCHTMTPPTFEVNHALLASLEAGQGTDDGEGHWFLKHRMDSKRPRVHPYGSDAKLSKRLRQMKESSWKYYIAQKEIHPAMLIRGRKFVLRAHVLVVVSKGTLQLFLHDNPLVSENEKQFVAEEAGSPWASQPVSALVLQSGSRSASYLLAESEELSPFLRASILEQISSIVATVFRELHTQHPFPLASGAPSQGSMYQLYGLDFMLNSSGKVFLLEVNRSPRIATGAMGDVHGCYTELLVDAMQILGVLEDTSSEQLHKPGKFGAWRDIYHATL